MVSSTVINNGFYHARMLGNAFRKQLLDNVFHTSSIIHQVQGVQEKCCFFTIHCNPSLAYIAVRDLQTSQRNASVQSESIYLHNCFSQLFLRQSSSENINHTMVSQTICIREHQPYNGFLDHLHQRASTRQWYLSPLTSESINHTMVFHPFIFCSASLLMMRQSKKLEPFEC